MKFKTSAIALAVAGTVAAPVVAQAEGEVYASARVGLEHIDLDGIADARVKSFSSRFGARGETDLGNGMTGFGRYEWDVDFNDSDKEAGSDTAASSEDDIGLRHRYVGVKGDFGTVTLGQTYHTFYNHVVGPLDNPWWSSGYAMINYRSRTDNGLTYSGNAGPVMLGVTGYFVWESEEENPDELEVGASFAVGDLGTIGIAYQSTETTQGYSANDEDIVGIAWSGIGIGDATLGISYMNQDDDDGIVIDLGIGNAYVHVEQLMLDVPDADILSITVGYTQSLGRNTTMWYEVHSLDADDSDYLGGGVGDSDDDITAVRAVLKYDIL
ncbi:MAG: porin [Gammaproteobacteria bacterium]|nr:porin [Gammaproteobacteria bacterium]